ncbi:MAG: hypothetical protein F4142_06285 [Nitrospira sp. SB0675_bin_23]|nr:hypothetical protein [Nitrospira sp. SB0667_bin_9]MYD31715.1 hypothetical protein [Nitrospira sp. SB0661_bin_20]MYH02172.1 hypothetical protein [Nitrospira sp. SB0675_bin_23]MYJ22878.1 hypothetical protein [Nitrospira sp. SB0673_bin_12]
MGRQNFLMPAVTQIDLSFLSFMFDAPLLLVCDQDYSLSEQESKGYIPRKSQVNASGMNVALSVPGLPVHGIKFYLLAKRHSRERGGRQYEDWRRPSAQRLPIHQPTL